MYGREEVIFFPVPFLQLHDGPLVQGRFTGQLPRSVAFDVFDLLRVSG